VPVSTRAQLVAAARRAVRDVPSWRKREPEPATTAEEPAGPPDLRIVPRARRRRRVGLVAGLVCVVIFGVMLGLVAFQAKIAADQLRLDKLDKETATAQATYERLRLRVVQLESPANVIAAATARGMVVPKSIQYVSPSVADVESVEAASGRVSPSASTPEAASGDDWAALKPVVGGSP
jgi:hypothetical protein